MNVRVATDSGSGFTKEEAANLGLDFFPLQVTIDDKNYLDGVDLDIDTLYDALEQGELPNTSLPRLIDIEDMMNKYNEEGVTDLVLITLSSGLSSTNSAISASAKSHGIKVHTTDIYSTLDTERYLAMAAAKMNQQGMEPEAIIEKIKEAVDGSKGYLIANDLDHLARGGRLTPTAAKLGGLLKIKPILEVSKETQGKVDVSEKVRTMSKAVHQAVKKILSQTDPNQEYIFYILSSRNEKEAQLAKEMILKEYPNALIKETPIYAVIASHTGMEAIGLQYIPIVEGVKE